MFRIKVWIRNFFGFTRAQVNGSIVLLAIMVIALFSEPVWQWWMNCRPPDLTKDTALLDSLLAHWPESEPQLKRTAVVERKRFSFDPNLASREEFMDLGFSPTIADRMIRYREKGGTFRIKSDLLKMYGMDSVLYEELYAFIVLPEKFQKSKQIERPTPTHKSPKAVNVVPALERFDINTADTFQLKKIRGIGDKLSLRIVKYRDRLGGFVAFEQLNEVFGLDSAVIHRIRDIAFIEPDFLPAQINLNTSTEEELSKHPYLSKAARSIVSYRFQHGAFTKVEDIRNVGSLDDALVDKIMPYLTIK